MPEVNTQTGDLLSAVEAVPCFSELLAKEDDHYNHELYLELIVYGRTYHRKRVGPYLRLLTFEPGEVVYRQGEWGGNHFYALVEGQLDILHHEVDRSEDTNGKLESGRLFGEIGMLAGVPYTNTVQASADQPVTVLEVQRPAIRLLRNLPAFSAELDRSYRHHGLRTTFEELRSKIDLDEEQFKELAEASQLRLLTKGQQLFEQGKPIKHIFVLVDGWLRRSTASGLASDEDFLGGGHCLGLDGVIKDSNWPCDAQIMGRSEILEIPISRLRSDPKLEWLVRERFGAAAADAPSSSRATPEGSPEEAALASQRVLIETGVVNATNLLVMDMNLCVRCGNCSMACHKVHGFSRLARRGIHIESPEASASKAKKKSPVNTRSLLAPSVCLHCKDPECLTGCPTGSIQRLAEGHIDIDQPTCIGCGDCATQCPYDAISLIPRRPAATEGRGLKGRLLDLVRLRPEPLPPAVDQTDDLMATKCNLCAGTSLNPSDSNGKPQHKAPAYSCEENCPTGALARIDPHSYFEEIGAIDGFLHLDQGHALGRNLHRSDPKRKLIHGLGIVLTIATALLAGLGVMRFGFDQPLAAGLGMRWLTGIAGLVATAVVMTYPLRRQVYRRRAGALRYWLPIHTYAGLIAAVVIFLHGGVDSGGILTTLLMWSWDVVILSGVVGILSYLIVPRLLTRIEGQPVLFDDLLERRGELEEQLQQRLSSMSGQKKQNLETKILPGLLSVRALARHITRRQELEPLISSTTARIGGQDRSLSDKDQEDMGRVVESAITLQRTQALIHLHRLLKIWLLPHVVSTSLMLALLLAHILQVVIL